MACCARGQTMVRPAVKSIARTCVARSMGPRPGYHTIPHHTAETAHSRFGQCMYYKGVAQHAFTQRRTAPSVRAFNDRSGYGIHAPPPSSYHRLMPCCRDRRRQRELASYSRGGWPGWGCMARHDLHLNTLHCTHTHTLRRAGSYRIISTGRFNAQAQQQYV